GRPRDLGARRGLACPRAPRPRPGRGRARALGRRDCLAPPAPLCGAPLAPARVRAAAVGDGVPARDVRNRVARRRPGRGRASGARPRPSRPLGRARSLDSRRHGCAEACDVRHGEVVTPASTGAARIRSTMTAAMEAIQGGHHDGSGAPRRPEPATRAGVELQGLTKSFRGGRGAVQAVAGIDLAVAGGETVALLGPNGAGKSITIDMLLGLLNPDAGSVQVFGMPPLEAVASGRIGAMLQTGSLIHDLTAREL